MTHRLRVIASTLTRESLTACSKDRAALNGPQRQRCAAQGRGDPPGRAGAGLDPADIEWEVCGKKLCTTPRHVEKDLESKLDVSRWMQQARDTIRFYRNKRSSEPSPVK